MFKNGMDQKVHLKYLKNADKRKIVHRFFTLTLCCLIFTLVNAFTFTKPLTFWINLFASLMNAINLVIWTRNMFLIEGEASKFITQVLLIKIEA